MTVMRFLEGSHLFQGVSTDDLQIIEPVCRHQAIEKGTEIFKEGEWAIFLYIVEKGRVALEMTLGRPDGSTTPPTTVASVGLGDAFGWSAIVEPHLLTLSAKAIENCDLVLIDGQELKQTLSQHHKMGYTVMANIANLLGQRLTATREAFVYERSWLFREKTDG